MPRPREFDETAALEAAMECFWRRGYEATSLRDLTASMNLTAPSLYNAFGGKQELFSRALEHYLDRTTRDRLRRLEQSLAPKAALHRFFTEIIEHSISDRRRKGCFLVNSALEIAPHDAECRAVIAGQFTEIEAFFRRCILKAQGNRTVSSDVDAGEVARLLLGILLGVRVLARTKPEREVLEGVVRPGLALLELPRKRKVRR
ncbi:MAG TPA: TetR/AcrR family transcriptional regulator [Xanthobacteraceae bacterium]|nr:TetR/AcrR family transcriptional regulator [Xanthobacteraceae bacterium]